MGNLQDPQKCKEKKALEGKEEVLRTAKKKLKINGSETAEVRKRTNELEETLKQYIHNDNLSSDALISGMAFEVESQRDFLAAVEYLDHAARETKQKLELLKTELQASGK